MAADIARWTIALLLLLVLVAASVSDVKRRKIPNWTVLAVALLFVAWQFAGAPIPWFSALAAAGISFVVTLGLFALGILGAGDSKLMTAVALFAGLGQLPLFVVATALCGGVLAVITLVVHPTRTWVALYHLRGKGNFGQSVPYGVAISLGGAIVVAMHFACAGSACARLIL